MPRKRITEEQIEFVRKNFSDMTKGELAAAAGVSWTTVDRIQARYHLRKSSEHLHNMGVRAGKASSVSRGGKFIGNQTPEAIAKRSATYKETYRTEDMRVRWGLKQLTKIKLKHGCKRQQDQRWYLRQLGYIISDSERVAYYTDATRRATRLEKLSRGEKRGFMRCYYEFRQYQEA